MYSKLSEEKNCRKVGESFNSFLTTPDEVGKYVELIEKKLNEKIMMQSSSSNNGAHIWNIEVLNPFDLEWQLISTKSGMKDKLKDLLGELKKLKVQKILVLEHKKTDNHKTVSQMFHASAKLIVNC